MVKRVALIGIGMAEETLTLEGRRALEQAECVFGAPRMLTLSGAKDKLAEPIYEAQKIRDRIRTSKEKTFAVLLSGDPGFYSAAEALERELREFCVSIYPGISSVAYFFSKLKRPWQHARLISAHGREANIVDTVRRHREVFVLTGKNVADIAKELLSAGFGELTVHLGENLGGQEENIQTLTVRELEHVNASSLSVLLIDHPSADARVRTGIPDEQFIRGEVPMSKAPVRAQVLSRLAISPADICFDIGAGTGSVSVEMALAAYEGRVYAIDRESKALDLVRENARKFHLGNIVSIHGSAPEVLEDLPAPDVVFIGGSSQKMLKTIQVCLRKNPSVRLVLSAVAIESIAEAWEAFESLGIVPEVLQLQSARSRAAGSMHLMMADNPVFIFSAGGRDG
ncbi:MAG TPA: precorrin-6y C5,15-methyltransferase (decarboxylating) subunit CbiE [Tissierellia bacterium]|nr:precorrin-6y C5,15-methyltransferase (decarboxylating) subunit CbiE [Tissierellia bacterium]